MRHSARKCVSLTCPIARTQPLTSHCCPLAGGLSRPFAPSHSPSASAPDVHRILEDLGLEDFLAKLKSVTSRANAPPAATPAKGSDNGTAHFPSNQAYPSEFSQIDIDQLKIGAVLKSNFTPSQRSAAPPPPAARSPRNPEGGWKRSGGAIFDDLPLLSMDGDNVFSAGNINRVAPQTGMVMPQNGDMYSDQGTTNIQSKISRMQETLKQSREMRATVSKELPARERNGGYETAMEKNERPTRTATTAVRSAPPPAVAHGTSTYGAPMPGSEAQRPGPATPDKDMDAIRREHNKWRMGSGGSPQRTPPQLLRKPPVVQQLSSPLLNQQPPPQFPTGPVTDASGLFLADGGERPLSEQELLAQVSHQYQGDFALQKVLWEMISSGAIRSTHELRAAAEGQMRRRDAHAAPMPRGHTRRSPGPQQGDWGDARYGAPVRHQPPAPIPLQRLTQPPAAFYQNAHGMPPAQPGSGGMQQGQDLDCLSRSFDTLNANEYHVPNAGSSKPQYAWGRTPSSRPQQRPGEQRVPFQPPPAQRVPFQPPQMQRMQQQHPPWQVPAGKMRANTLHHPQYEQTYGVNGLGPNQPRPMLMPYANRPVHPNNTVWEPLSF